MTFVLLAMTLALWSILALGMNADTSIREQRQRESDRILARLREVAPPILERYPVEAAYVYGSVARGTVTPFSDVDIALLLTSSLSPYEQFDLELSIQGEIEAAGDFTSVDVRAINQAPLPVKGRVIQNGALIFERDRARRIAFEVATRKLYFDFAPAARRLRDAFLQRIHKEGLLHD